MLVLSLFSTDSTLICLSLWPPLSLIPFLLWSAASLASTGPRSRQGWVPPTHPELGAAFSCPSGSVPLSVAATPLLCSPSPSFPSSAPCPNPAARSPHQRSRPPLALPLNAPDAGKEPHSALALRPGPRPARTGSPPPGRTDPRPSPGRLAPHAPQPGPHPRVLRVPGAGRGGGRRPHLTEDREPGAGAKILLVAHRGPAPRANPNAPPPRPSPQRGSPPGVGGGLGSPTPRRCPLTHDGQGAAAEHRPGPPAKTPPGGAALTRDWHGQPVPAPQKYWASRLTAASPQAQHRNRPAVPCPPALPGAPGHPPSPGTGSWMPAPSTGRPGSQPPPQQHRNRPVFPAPRAPPLT